MSEDQSRGRRRTYGNRSPEASSEAGSSQAQEPSAKIFKSQTQGSVSHSTLPISTPDQQPGPSTSGRRINNRFEVVNTRPKDVVKKQGTEGNQIRLVTNYFQLLATPKWRIYQYHVEFTPDIEVMRVRRGILSEHGQVLGSGYIFDGKTFFTSKRLEKDTTVLQGTSKTDIKYTITVTYTTTVSKVDSSFIRVLNLILRRAMNGLNLELVGRELYDPRAKIPILAHHIELWPGYDTSIRQHENSMLLCTEIVHKVMRTETVYDILLQTSRNPARHQEEFKASVIGAIVLTDYNNKTYCINEVDFSQTPQATFNMKGKDVSFIEYYQMKYKISIRDIRQPLLISKSKEKSRGSEANDIVILIPELCRVTGLTDAMRSNFQLMRAMKEQTQLNPQKRIDRLETFKRRLQSTPASVKLLNDWDLKLDNKLTTVMGRNIEAQKIVFRSNKVRTDSKADWSREFRNEKMLTTPSDGLDRWAVVAPQRNSRELRQLLDALYRVSQGIGLVIRPPREIIIPDDRTGTYVRALDDCVHMDPKLVLCLVPNNNVERYSAIKKKSYVERSVPTQVVTMRVASNNRGLMSIATKIGIQINCKLGYAPWMIELPLSGLMTIGFDMAKSSRDRSKSYGALVASMDLQQNCTFFSTVAECSAYDSLSNNLWAMVMKALRQYRREHGKLPTRILFYRDGLGSGSLQHIFDYEVKEIVEKLEQEYKRVESPTPPMLAYIMVSKRINTRFFCDSRNPPPGTVVDDVVTLPERYDFFLVSQSVNQGTVSPTNYNVLYSNIRLSPDQIQKLTYKMCHLYYNWNGTTRVPAVCQYASKLATLVATNLHSIPNAALEKKFYYL